jgi:pSer/pThr/pTyr-binding forkhead associated (FHA) protein
VRRPLGVCCSPSVSSEPQKTKRLIACPRCKFPNPATGAACLQCKTKLDGSADATQALKAPTKEELDKFKRAPGTTSTVGPPGAGTSAVGAQPGTQGPAGAGKSAVGAPPGAGTSNIAGKSAVGAGVTRAMATPGGGPADMEFFRALAAAASPTGTSDPAKTMVGPPPGLRASDRLQTQKISRSEVEARTADPGTPSTALAPPMSQVARVDPNDPRILGWLACDPFVPVPLGLAPVLTMGRGGSCDLVLPHPGVSRVHAVVRLAGKELLFEDRSSYGSYLNGKKIQSAALRENDVLLVGPYEIQVRGPAHGRSGARRDGEDTRPIAIGRDLPSGDAMSGRLERQPLAEVLQALEFNKKTGTLELVCGETTGTLVVYEGQPMFAAFGPLADAHAVFAMLVQKTGYFSFRKKIEAGEKTMSTSITGLLLEASRREDEGT